MSSASIAASFRCPNAARRRRTAGPMSLKSSRPRGDGYGARCRLQTRKYSAPALGSAVLDPGGRAERCRICMRQWEGVDAVILYGRDPRWGCAYIVAVEGGGSSARTPLGAVTFYLGTQEVLISEHPVQESRTKRFQVSGGRSAHRAGDVPLWDPRRADDRFTMLIHLPREEEYPHRQTIKNGPALAVAGPSPRRTLSHEQCEHALPEQLRRSLTLGWGKELSRRCFRTWGWMGSGVMV